jgi:hypothetical protein
VVTCQDMKGQHYGDKPDGRQKRQGALKVAAMIQTQDRAVVVVVGTIKDRAVKIAQITLLPDEKWQTSTGLPPSKQVCATVVLMSICKGLSKILSCKLEQLLTLARYSYNCWIVSRLQNNSPVPPLTQSFFYNVFGQLVNLGREAPNWVKDLYQAFSQVGNFGSIMQGICIGSATISNCALQYAANTVHHIASNFERKSTQYFFCRFSDSNDEWYQAEVSIKDRKKLAKYCYGKAARIDYHWPNELESEVLRSRVDSFALSINMGGPLPITDTSLSANAHEYLPWLYQVLQRLEQKVFIKEPVPQTFASRAYVRRKLQEVQLNYRRHSYVYKFIIN